MSTQVNPSSRKLCPPDTLVAGAGGLARARSLRWVSACGLALLCLASAVARDDEDGQPPSFADIDREVQGIKQEILDINSALSSLEEELLYPPDSRLTVFLSLRPGATLDIGLLRIDLNGETLVHHDYSDTEMEALRKGGVHKPYIGRIENGDYMLQAHLSGTGKKDQVFDLATSVNFTKRRGTKYVELQVSESRIQGTPRLTVQSW
jgi:hypothetical protein